MFKVGAKRRCKYQIIRSVALRFFAMLKQALTCEASPRKNFWFGIIYKSKDRIAEGLNSAATSIK